MPTDADDQKNLSSEAEILRRMANTFTMEQGRRMDAYDNDIDAAAMCEALKELCAWFDKMGRKAPAQPLATLCMVVTTGIESQVLEPYEEMRKADDYRRSR